MRQFLFGAVLLTAGALTPGAATAGDHHHHHHHGHGHHHHGHYHSHYRGYAQPHLHIGATPYGTQMWLHSGPDYPYGGYGAGAYYSRSPGWYGYSRDPYCNHGYRRW